MRSTDGSNDDVCLLTLLFEILGMGVADGNSTIAILLLHHELGHGLSDDVTSPEHDTLLSRCLNIVMAQQRKYTQWSRRDEAWQAYRHATNVDGMKSVNILTIVDSHNDFLLVKCLGRGSCTINPSISSSEFRRFTHANSSSSVTSSS